MGASSALAAAQIARNYYGDTTHCENAPLFKLDGKVALVTGSSRGIGFAIAVGLAEHGATIVLSGSNPVTLAEARVALLRETGVPRANVHRAFHLMERRLCIAEGVMLELQDLWCDGMLPSDWDKSTHASDDAREPCAYSALLLTDVQTTQSRRRLPMSLEAFCSHVERRANSVREVLKECWIAAAAGRLDVVGPPAFRAGVVVLGVRRGEFERRVGLTRAGHDARRLVWLRGSGVHVDGGG